MSLHKNLIGTFAFVYKSSRPIQAFIKTYSGAGVVYKSDFRSLLGFIKPYMGLSRYLLSLPDEKKRAVTFFSNWFFGPKRPTIEAFDALLRRRANHLGRIAN